MRNAKPILLVEDDDLDAITTKRALADLKVRNKLVHRVNGDDALEFLRDEANPKPCIILLDLNMPRMDGFEFLREIKADPALKRIPMVVLTTSDAEQNVLESYDLGVVGYIVKAIDYKQFVDTMRAISVYWNLNQLPTR